MIVRTNCSIPLQIVLNLSQRHVIWAVIRVDSQLGQIVR